MPDAIYADEKVMLLKLEADYGVDPTPTGAANAILGRNFSCLPMEAEDLPRDNVMPWDGNRETLHGDYWGVVSFEVELAGSGTAGTPPAIGPVLRALGSAEETVDSTVVYRPQRTPQASVAIWFQDGPTRHVFLGGRGTGELVWPAQDVPRLQATITGLVTTLPSAQTRPTPNFSAFKDPVIPGHTRTPVFRVNAIDLVMRRLSLNLGNQVAQRFLVGRHEIVIAERREQLSFTVEATPLAHFDPFALAAARTRVPVELRHGTVAGHRMRLAADTCQLARPGRAEEQQNRVEWPLTARPLPTSGNDQWSLTFS